MMTVVMISDIHVDDGNNDVGDDDNIEGMLKAPNKKENTKIRICPIIHQVGIDLGLCIMNTDFQLHC